MALCLNNEKHVGARRELANTVCLTTAEYTQQAAGHALDKNGAGMLEALEIARRSCATVDDYQALISAVVTLQNDQELAQILASETVYTLRSSGELVHMAGYCLNIFEDASLAL